MAAKTATKPADQFVAAPSGYWEGQAEVQTEDRLSLPHCQVLSPKGENRAEIEAKPHGIFIPVDQADVAGFMGGEGWSLIEKYFAGADEPTHGWLCKEPRFLVVKQTGAEVQRREDFQGRRTWKYAGPAFDKGGRTAIGQAAQDEKDRGVQPKDATYRIVSRKLLLFLAPDGSPLHTDAPFQLTFHAAWGAAIGNEVKEFFNAYRECWSKARKQAGLPGGFPKGDELCCASVQMRLSWTQSAHDKNPNVVPVSLVLPTLIASEVSTEKQAPRLGGKRQITVSYRSFYEVKIDHRTEAGKLARQWNQDFESWAKGGDSAEDAPPVERTLKTYEGEFDPQFWNFAPDGTATIQFKVGGGQPVLTLTIPQEFQAKCDVPGYYRVEAYTDNYEVASMNCIGPSTRTPLSAQEESDIAF